MTQGFRGLSLERSKWDQIMTHFLFHMGSGEPWQVLQGGSSMIKRCCGFERGGEARAGREKAERAREAAAPSLRTLPGGAASVWAHSG